GGAAPVVDAGDPGAAAAADAADAAAAPPIEVAVSDATAKLIEAEVGDLLEFEQGTLRVAGIYEVVDPDDRFWAHASDLARASVDQPPGGRPNVRAGVFVDPETLPVLRETFAAGELVAWMPVRAERLDFAEIGEVRAQIREFVASPFALPEFGSLAFRSGVPDLVERIVGRVTAASALLALVGSGLLGVLLAVFALGVRSVIERRAPGLALAAARGAGAGVLRGAMAIEGLLLAVPISALAIVAAAAIIPVDAGPAGWLLPALVAVAPPVLFAA